MGNALSSSTPKTCYPTGKDIYAVTEFTTPRKMANVIGEFVGEKVKGNEMTIDQFEGARATLGEEMWPMIKVCLDRLLFSSLRPQVFPSGSIHTARRHATSKEPLPFSQSP